MRYKKRSHGGDDYSYAIRDDGSEMTLKELLHKRTQIIMEEEPISVLDFLGNRAVLDTIARSGIKLVGREAWVNACEKMDKEEGR